MILIFQRIHIKQMDIVIALIQYANSHLSIDWSKTKRFFQNLIQLRRDARWISATSSYN